MSFGLIDAERFFQCQRKSMLVEGIVTKEKRNKNFRSGSCVTASIAYKAVELHQAGFQVSEIAESLNTTELYVKWALLDKGLLNKKSKGGRKGRMVNQYDLDGNFLKAHESADTVHRQFGIHAHSIRKACLGLHHTAGGYKWRYADV